MYLKHSVSVGLSYLVFEIHVKHGMLHKVLAVDVRWQDAPGFLLTGVPRLRA